MGEHENISLDEIYKELKYIHKKVDQLEHIMIPVEKMTAQDKKELDEAIKEYKEGKTVRFRDIKKG
ncbi:MAG TPA: hypothetical protein VJH24_04805 [Candidatus Bilamarchaeaceae archaeon]|nr:hypothetical protein [Candidatus Bilamarchaeaceae archaeon]